MKNIRIEKFSIQEKFNIVEFNYEETRQDITQIVRSKIKSKFIPHDDLTDAMDNLKRHFVLLTETVSKEKVSNDELDFIKITGIKITNKGETNGVNIIGSRILKDERTVNFQTPFANYDPNIGDYKFTEELETDIDALTTEIKAYLNGKFSVQGTQLSLGDQLQEAA